MLRLGVEGKAAGWRTLTLADTDTRLDPARWTSSPRAGRQADLLEDLRRRRQAGSQACPSWRGIRGNNGRLSRMARR
jgi:hypothetical protein